MTTQNEYQLGTVVRFDPEKGYGFITPDEGGDDVFMHVNDLTFGKNQLKVGARVRFIEGHGDRGANASDVSLLEPAPLPVVQTPVPATTSASSVPERIGRSEQADDDLVDVLSQAEFTRSITELALHAAPSLTGDQILALRSALADFAAERGWVESD